MWRNYSISDTQTGEVLRIPDVVADVRARAERNGNPGILIAKYTVFNEAPSTDQNAAKRDLWDKLHSESGPGGDWWARSADGGHASTWPNTWLTNITRFVTPDAGGLTWPQWKVARDHNLFFSGGAFDAIFFDNWFYRPRASVDWDGDGNNDSKDDPKVREWYRQGNLDALGKIREIAPELFVIGNVNGNPGTGEGMLTEPEYQGQIGSLYEYAMGKSFSTETWGGWEMMMSQYQTTISNSRYRVAIFNVEGGAQDYQFMRYSLASCLMDDGYFYYGDPQGWYRDIHWFDEFEIELGRAMDPPQNSAWKQGVFMRRFEKGMAIVNPKGNGTQTVTVPEGYRRIAGTQDPSVNNGEIATSVTLLERDGIILISESVTDTAPPEAPAISVD
jgi:hypothetical protein